MTSKINESGYSLLQKIQFYIGSGGRSIISGLVNAAFIKYYTDFIGLDPKWMGYVFVIFTVWAAINDPIIGIWLDKRPYKKGIGKYRPIFIKSIPFWVVITLAFPWANPSWSQLGISVYLFLALMLWETAATAYSTSYGAIAVNLFLTTDERAEVEVIGNFVGALAIFGSSIPIMILSMDVSNQTMLIFFGIVTIRAQNLDLKCGTIRNIQVKSLKADSCHTFVRLMSVRSPITNISVDNLEGGCRCMALNLDGCRDCRVKLFDPLDPQYQDGVGDINNVRISNMHVHKSSLLDSSPLIDLRTNVRDFVVKDFRRNRQEDVNPAAPTMLFSECRASQMILDGVTFQQVETF